MGLTIFYRIFLDVSHIQSYGILSIPHNIVMDLNKCYALCGEMIIGCMSLSCEI